MILRDQLECEKKRFISDLQNANYSLVTAAKLAAQTCIWCLSRNSRSSRAHNLKPKECLVRRSGKVWNSAILSHCLEILLIILECWFNSQKPSLLDIDPVPLLMWATSILVPIAQRLKFWEKSWNNTWFTNILSKGIIKILGYYVYYCPR